MFKTIRDSLSSNAVVLVSVAVFGLLLHGIQASQLGLYWDDTGQLLGKMQRAGTDVPKFIFSGTFWFGSERPVAYVPFMVARAAFAVNLTTLHWLLVVLFVLNAVVLTSIARKMVDEEWFAFAVGAIFLSYPLAPLHVLYAALIHHLVALLLALLSISFFLDALRTGEKRLRCFALAAVTYLASVLTFEVFALIPLAFVVFYAVANDKQQSVDRRRLSPADLRRPEVYCFASLLILFGAYGLWREAILPAYGQTIYPISSVVLGKQFLAKKFLQGAATAFMPWEDAIRHILSYPLGHQHVLLSIILSVGVGVILFFCWDFLEPTSEPSAEGKSRGHGSRQWLRIAAIGSALALAGVITVDLTPVSIMSPRNIFDFGAGVALKGNLAPTVGLAVALPALLVLLVRLYRSRPVLGGLLTLSFLVYFGFTSSLLDIHEMSSPSNFWTVLSSYSLKHRVALFAYIVTMTVVCLVMICSSTPTARRLFMSERANSIFAQVGLYFPLGAVAFLVLLGSVYHLSVKRQFISAWDQHKAMLEQLQSVAPALQDDTFVVVVRDRNDPVSPSHYESSSFLMALYGNKSIMGNTDWQLRFHREGVESTYYGKSVDRRNRRISYERLLIFEFDGRNLRMLPKMEVKTDQGEPLVVLNNPDRVLSGPPFTTAVSRYLGITATYSNDQHPVFSK